MRDIENNWASSIDEVNARVKGILDANAEYAEDNAYYLEVNSNDGRRVFMATRRVHYSGMYINDGWTITYGKLNVGYRRNCIGYGYEMGYSITKYSGIGDDYKIPTGAFYKKEVIAVLKKINEIKGGIFSEAMKALNIK